MASHSLVSHLQRMYHRYIPYALVASKLVWHNGHHFTSKSITFMPINNPFTNVTLLQYGFSAKSVIMNTSQSPINYGMSLY